MRFKVGDEVVALNSCVKTSIYYGVTMRVEGFSGFYIRCSCFGRDVIAHYSALINVTPDLKECVEAKRMLKELMERTKK